MTFDLCRVVNRQRDGFHADRRRRGFEGLKKSLRIGCGRRVEQIHHLGGAWQELHQELKPLARHCGREIVESSSVPTRVRKARDEPAADWIADLHEDDGDRARFMENRRGHWRGIGQDHIGS